MDTILEYKCPACGGSLSFDSASQNMKCPYCDTELDVEALKQLEQENAAPGEDSMQWEETPGNSWQEGEEENISSYVCESCGGQILTDATTAATSCPYCGNPVVMPQQVSGVLKPDLVIPFQLDKEAAEAALSKHLLKKPLLPKAFKTENHIREVKGVYVPFWLYDSHAHGDARYHATRTRMWSSGRYMYTETSHYSVLRAGELDFEAVPVDGSEKMDNDMMESLEPYDLSQAVPFQTAYLSGFYADKYDVSAQDCNERANDRIRTSTQDTLRGTVMGYNTVVQENCTVRLSGNKARYALFPVWLLTTRYRNETYHFAMNGQTGKLVGNLPIDWGAFFKWWGIIAAGVSAAACLVYWLAW